VQEENAPSSSLQRKALSGRGKLTADREAKKLKLALELLVAVGGLLVIFVSGGVVQISQMYSAGVTSVLPEGSVARTRKKWIPCCSPAKALGLVQEVNGLPSRLQEKLLPSEAVKLKFPVLLFVTRGGLVVMMLLGGVLSTRAAFKPAKVMLLRAGIWPGRLVVN